MAKGMTDMKQVPIGIVSAGMYLPDVIVTSVDIAEESGLPEWVVREKLGIHEKRMAGLEDHPNQMAVWAAEDCLSNSYIKPDEIDVVLCTTEEWKEYIQWSAGIDLAYQIGATRAWGMDLHMRCCTTVSALKIAKDMMDNDPEINTVLIGGGYRVGDLVNLKDKATSFTFNIGAGAAAILLRKNWPRNHVLGSHLITDGSLSKNIIIPASGTVQFPTDEAVAKGLFYINLFDGEEMKERLNEVSLDNWMHCIDEALRKSGYERDDISFLNMIHMKVSAYKDMLQRLNLTEMQGIYNEYYGHIGEQDSIINIIEGVKLGRLKDGDLMVIVAAGVGYVWGATCVKWGYCEG